MTGAEPQRQTTQPPWEQVFLDHLDLIQRVAEFAARRSGFQREDVEDFVATVKEKLLADDYAVLRKHRGDSKLTTYLTAVVHNLFKDFRNHKLGKFRPSAKAKRLGPVAVDLERLLVRDQHELEAAIEILKGRSDEDLPTEELRELAAQLPPRQPRRFVGEEVLEQKAHASSGSSGSSGSPAEERVEESERAATAERVQGILNRALLTLEALDLLILRMHYRDGCSYTDVAAALRLDRRALYARKDKSMKKLHAAVQAEGLTWEEVREIVGWQGPEIRADFRGSSENSGNGSVQSLDGPETGEGS